MKRFYPTIASRAILFKTTLLSFAAIAMSHVGQAQTTNDYRSKANGNWNLLTTWERYNGTTWVQPTNIEGVPSNLKGAITILNTDTVTVSADVTADQLTIDAGAQLTIANNQDLNIENGSAGSDFFVNGTLVNHGGLNLNFSFSPFGQSTMSVNAGAIYKHNQTAGTVPITNATWNLDALLEFSNGGATTVTVPSMGPLRVLIANNTNVTFNGGGGTQTLTIGAGTGTDFQIGAGSALTLTNLGYENVTLNANATAIIDGTLNLNGAYNTSGLATLTTVNGTFNYKGTNVGITAAKFIVASGGIFDYGLNGGTVPTMTWNSGSTLELSGMTDTYPAGMNQSFHHVTFQSALTDNAEMETNLTVLGNLTMSNTNSGNDLRLTNNSSDYTIAVTGNYSQTSGTFALVSDDGDAALTVGGNFSLSGGTFTPKEGAGLATVNVTGNLTVSGGTFDQHAENNTSTSTVNVTGNFVLSGGTYDLSGTNGETGFLNLGGNYTHSAGVLTETASGNGSITFVNDKQHIFSSAINPTATINYTVGSGDTLQFDLPTTLLSSGGTFNAQAGSTIGVRHAQGLATVAAGALGAVRTSTRTYSNAAHYIYNGNAAQVTGSGVTGAASLTIANTGAAAVSLTNSPFTVTGSVLISSGTFALGTQQLLVGGNWTNNSAFTASGIAPQGKVTMNGTALQTIGGTAATTFNHLDLNKTTGTVVLAQNMNMAGTLNIGVNLNLATFILTMSAASPSIGTLGAGSFTAAKMVIADGGGEMRKTLAGSGAVNVGFPIGDNTGTAEFSPVGMQFTAGTYAGYVAAKVTDAIHPVLIDPVTGYITRYWTITQSGLSAFTATVGANYVDADIVGPEADIRMAKWDGAEPWVRFDPSITVAVNLLNATVTSFSSFTGLSVLQGLPVKLSSFSGSLVDKSADLKWKTSEEVNSSRYDVEYSTDGRNFKLIGSVQSRNSVSGSTYSFKHSGLSSGKNYYRLKMVDIDGKFQYSHVVMLSYNGSLKVLNVFPNPTTNGVTLSFDKALKGATIQVISMEGRTMSSVSVPAGATQMQVNMSGMIRGIYNVVYTNDGERSVQRVQKN